VAGLEHALQQMISTWYLTAGYLGIVLAMALESCCVPLPSELVMPLAGYYAVIYPERFSLLGVGLAGALGCLLGSSTAYAIGRSGGRPLLLHYGRYLLISQADSDRADRLFARHGGAVTFFSRLLPVIRTYISLPAGIARTPFARFCVYTGLGSLPWCLALAWVGTKAGEHSQQLASVFRGLDVVVLAALLVGLVWYVRRHIRHDRAARQALASHSTAAQGARTRPRRPRPIPASHLDFDERPTLAHMERVPMWPNRYARPVGEDTPESRQGPSASSKGQPPAKRRR
jgi:membrane protein DedA with SNARE-associated domain